MSTKSSSTGRGGRRDSMTKVLDAVGAAHDAGHRSGADSFVASIRRICTSAERMLEKDEVWRMREGAKAGEVLDVVFDSVRDCEQEYRSWDREKQTGREDLSPHPFGVVAEQLAAKTIATFGGAEAVQGLRKWTRRTKARATRATDIE